jgi:valyl-tRNA synthetase
MMMMGIHFMGDVPFRDVYIHALVRDADGKKMSKSKGNVIDPLYVIDKFGTDAFRFTLAAFAAQGRDIKLSEDRIDGYRHFINKLWNACRFSLMHLQGFESDRKDDIRQDLSCADRWILSRLNHVTDTVTGALDDYRFNEGAGALYQFVWHEFCDWYVEIIKPVLYGDTGSSAYHTTLTTLWTVVNETLRLLHPFIPFVTEEIWDKLPGTNGSIMKAPFPTVKNERMDTEAEKVMALVMGVTTGIRNVRGEMNVPPHLVLEASVQAEDERIRRIIDENKTIVTGLAKLDGLTVTPPGKRPASCATAVFGDCTIFVSLKDIIDFEAEKGRLGKEISKIEKEMTGIEKKLSNENFLSKAPQEVVDGVRAKQTMFLEKKTNLEKHLAVVKALAEEQ